MLITHLRKARHHHNPRPTISVPFIWRGPAVREAARLREDHDASVGGAFHNFDQIAAAGIKVVQAPCPRRECGAKFICRSSDVSITEGQVSIVVFGTGTEVV